ncbi:MAG TPA: hypothetical protein VFI65_31310 [Streptosporangiaceae bacterium]|nr:hypothetical protein [Streptosporangiaceae bacterium]
MAQTTLERRYRRLLICYPVSHRAEYGEEMIGVLLDSTPAGQRNPALADALSLFGGGLRVRTRALLANSSDPGWREALALTTLIAPIVLAALAYHQIGWHLAFLPPNFGSLKNAGLMLIRSPSDCCDSGDWPPRPPPCP